jgi:hypothetical protein
MAGYYAMTVPLNQPSDTATAKKVYATPGLSGVRLSVDWSLIEPSAGSFDFSSVDQTLSLIPSSLLLDLSLVAGLSAPAWIAQSCPSVTVNINTGVRGRAAPVAVAAPWTSAYSLAYIGAFRALLGHLKTVGVSSRIVGCIASIYHGIDGELTIPWTVDNKPNMQNAQIWANAGYTPALALSGWVSAVGHLAKLLPDATLSIPLLTPSICLPWVNNAGQLVPKDDTTDQIAAFLAHAGGKYPSRAMAFFTAGSTSPLPAIYGDAETAGCVIGCQTNAWGGGLGCETGSHKDPGPPGADALRAVLANLSKYTNYIELHPADLLRNGSVIAGG